MKKLLCLLVFAVLAIPTVAQASYQSGSCSGSFSVNFSNADFVTGLGWSTGSGGTISFSGSCSGCDFGPGVYGWKTNPLVEYYIGKGGGSTVGSYSCDGRSYTFKVLRRYNAPSIQGTATFDQYNADGSRSSPVNFGCHSYHWQRLGKPSGNHNYQVVAVESWRNHSGSASVSVSNSNWYTHWVGSGSASFHCGGGGGSTSTTTTTSGWTTTTTTSGGGGGQRFRNRSTGKYIDGMGRTNNGANAGQWSSSGSSNQRWSLVSAGSGYYYIQCASTSMRLDSYGQTNNGAACRQYRNTTHQNAQWRRESADSGYEYLTNRSTGMRIDGMGRTNNGADLGLWRDTTHNNAKWRLE